MKKLLLFAALLSFAACNMEQGYTINGTITGEGDAVVSGKAYLANRDKENPIADTVDIVNGKFTFKGNIAMPERYFISFDDVKGRIGIFLENEKYNITANTSNLAEASITGGTTQSMINAVSEKSRALQAELGDTEALIKEYRSPEASAERKEEIANMFDAVDEKVKAFEDSIISANPFSYYALNDFYSNVNDMDLTEAEARLNEFKARIEFAENKTLKNIEETINTLKGLQNGSQAPDFTMKDSKGKDITLSDIYKKNKITMIDFWAGWCNPCRQFNPKLVKIYAQYHKKGFEILGVSMDRDRDQWLNAIKDDKLVWPQVSDVNFWDCEPVRLYAVRYIPQNAFVDQDGKILARKLQEEEIIKFLEEHLK